MAGFGLMEFERDEAVVRALLEAVVTFGAERGMELLRGPISYSTNEVCGALIDRFDTSPVVDMPNTKPATSNVRSFQEKKDMALNKAHVDVGLNLVLHDGSDIGSLGPLFDDPVFAGFKVFMGETTGSCRLRMSST